MLRVRTASRVPAGPGVRTGPRVPAGSRVPARSGVRTGSRVPARPGVRMAGARTRPRVRRMAGVRTVPGGRMMSEVRTVAGARPATRPSLSRKRRPGIRSRTQVPKSRMRPPRGISRRVMIGRAHRIARRITIGRVRVDSSRTGGIRIPRPIRRPAGRRVSRSAPPPIPPRSPSPAPGHRLQDCPARCTLPRRSRPPAPHRYPARRRHPVGPRRIPVPHTPPVRDTPRGPRNRVVRNRSPGTAVPLSGRAPRPDRRIRARKKPSSIAGQRRSHSIRPETPADPGRRSSIPPRWPVLGNGRTFSAATFRAISNHGGHQRLSSRSSPRTRPGSPPPRPLSGPG